jgi:hypothetical protein
MKYFILVVDLFFHNFIHKTLFPLVLQFIIASTAHELGKIPFVETTANQGHFE